MEYYNQQVAENKDTFGSIYGKPYVVRCHVRQAMMFSTLRSRMCWLRSLTSILCLLENRRLVPLQTMQVRVG